MSHSLGEADNSGIVPGLQGITVCHSAAVPIWVPQRRAAAWCYRQCLMSHVLLHIPWCHSNLASQVFKMTVGWSFLSLTAVRKLSCFVIDVTASWWQYWWANALFTMPRTERKDRSDTWSACLHVVAICIIIMPVMLPEVRSRVYVSQTNP